MKARVCIPMDLELKRGAPYQSDQHLFGNLCRHAARVGALALLTTVLLLVALEVFLALLSLCCRARES